jgi:hypothetical protein
MEDRGSQIQDHDLIARLSPRQAAKPDPDGAA